MSYSVCRHVLHVSLVPRLFSVRESLGTRVPTLVMLHLAKVYHCSCLVYLLCCRTPKRLQPSSVADDKVLALTHEVAVGKRKSRMKKVRVKE